MEVIISIILGGIGGAFFSALITWRMLREDTVRKLISNSLKIQALEEAWILDGQNYQKLSFSKNPHLTENTADKNFIRKVELRFILDEAKWNSPKDTYYGLIGTRRVWIVRDTIEKDLAYVGGKPLDYHPAIISSRAEEELSGWIEMVTSAKKGFMLSYNGIKMLKHLLGAISTEDRIDFFDKNDTLTKNALKFLKWYNKKYKKCHSNNKN
jgi:hypothetical protein